MIHVLLLAFNEEGGIGACLSRLNEVLRGGKEPFRFIVVDDGSKDSTAEIVRGLAKTFPATLLRHPQNLGVARGFDTGLRHIAQNAGPDDIIVTLEGDNTNDPAFLPRMFDAIRRGFDVVCASRYRRGGRYVGFPFKRRFFSFGANWLMRLFFPIEGVRDYTIFFRVYRARTIAAAIEHFGQRFIERRGFTANAEILFKAATASNIRCAEVPLVYRYDLKKGGSKMKVGDNLREYGTLFASLFGSPVSLRLRQSLAMLGVGLAVGLHGIGWGLPAMDRLSELLPASLIADPGFHRKLAQSRDELYEKMEANRRLPVDFILHAEDLPAGWTFPPDRLLNSCRSFFLRSENADEQKNLTYLAHMRPRELKFDPYAASYGGAFLYPLGAWYAAAAATRMIRITSDLVYYFQDPARMAAVFKAGRLFSVLAFAFSAAALATIGRCLGGAMGGWLAGLLFLILPVTGIVSHTINPYGWATLWGLVMFRFVVLYLDRGEESDLLKAAGAFGLCFGASIAFWAFSLAMPTACVLRVRGGSDWRAELRALVKAGVAASLVFFVMNPYLFFKYKDYQGELEYELYGFPFALSLRGLRDFLFEFLGFNMGSLLAILALGAAVYQSLRSAAAPVSRIVALMFLLGYVQLAMRVTDPQHGRHFLPFIALGCLLAAETLSSLARSRWRRAAWVLLAAILLQDLPANASYLWTMSRETRGLSTRLEAGRWINEHIPAGRAIGLVAPPQPGDTPPFRLDRYALTLFATPGQLADHALPDYVVISELRRSDAMDLFLESRYRVLRSFEPPRLFPWVPVLGRYAFAGARVDVLERR